jgi:hypothetical protein
MILIMMMAIIAAGVSLIIYSNKKDEYVERSRTPEWNTTNYYKVVYDDDDMTEMMASYDGNNAKVAAMLSCLLTRLIVDTGIQGWF